MAEARSIMETNFLGPLCLTQQFSQLLIASGDGRILNIASVGCKLRWGSGFRPALPREDSSHQY